MSAYLMAASYWGERGRATVRLSCNRIRRHIVIGRSDRQAQIKRGQPPLPTRPAASCESEAGRGMAPARAPDPRSGPGGLLPGQVLDLLRGGLQRLLERLDDIPLRGGRVQLEDRGLEVLQLDGVLGEHAGVVADFPRYLGQLAVKLGVEGRDLGLEFQALPLTVAGRGRARGRPVEPAEGLRQEGLDQLRLQGRGRGGRGGWCGG